ncbi:oxygen-independent coproporphyrinogen III oxidase [Pseudovibrio exalbescens]|uniref:oxygen-independent coproporphyrinogen III oxidase n=1 Tax=Pseudovibrio exalbescens TaxID=197461 RepID=UPI0023672B8D|nr:oxygen-independent coproporphyrinogen III oxidase [Pseudovibrio exalbescens]MDD7911103.1 oxygen-independent coproporphyrinogen III oxidase [Pseudovibrio exalbescens]
MTSLELRYATQSVPRYTSYPTAPHFSEAVSGADYEGWLAAIPEDTPLSLYLHVPFCREMCHYCGCNTKATKQDEPVVAFTKTLRKEISIVLQKLGSKRPVQHIHWGGGTPSLLPREAFLATFELLKSGFEFLPDLEHAIELDPRTVTPYLAETLTMAGVNRASLGVQDFDLTVQESIGRVQSFECVEEACKALRGAGISEINFDLMYGLPHQTSETILRTVDLTKQLAPGRIALFGYAHVPWFKKHQKLISEDALPKTQERIELSDIARDALIAAGYTAIGLDHFALPEDSMAVALNDGTLKRNFQGYTTDKAETLLGFGPSSIGFLPKGYVQNIHETREWTRQVEDGALPIKKGIAVDADDLCRAHIIERLMTAYEVDIAEAAERFGLNLNGFAESFAQLQPLQADGLVSIDGSLVKVTQVGERYVRVVAAAFDAYLHANAARHSVAV